VMNALEATNIAVAGGREPRLAQRSVAQYVGATRSTAGGHPVERGAVTRSRPTADEAAAWW
jgi:hypothetical protein